MVASGIQLRCWWGRAARQNSATQVLLPFNWRGGNSKQLAFVDVEIKVFWPILTINLELLQICDGGGASLCAPLRFPLAGAYVVVVFRFVGIKLFCNSSHFWYMALMVQEGTQHVNAA